MLILTAALLGAVLSGDLLTFFIFWEAATAAAAFLDDVSKERIQPQRHPKVSSYGHHRLSVRALWALNCLRLNRQPKLHSSTASFKHDLAASDKNLLIIAFVFIAAGYAIEAAIVPFHFWLPDAYTAAPAPSAAFLSALVDQGSYYILIRILLYIIIPTGPNQVLDWTFMLAISAAVTMVVGNIFALIQNDIKRLIAYICVADVGYNLVAITSVTSLGLSGNLYFFLIGGITTALAFMAIGIINSHGIRTLSDFAGLGKKMPLVSLALVIAGLSFAGVPPLGGFIGKYLVFTAALQANLSWLAVIGVLTSVLQTAYIFRLMNVMYSKKPKDGTTIKENKRILIPVFILVAALFILGLFPNIVLQLLTPATHQLSALIPSI